MLHESNENRFEKFIVISILAEGFNPKSKLNERFKRNIFIYLTSIKLQVV